MRFVVSHVLISDSLETTQDVQGSPTRVEEIHGQENQPENQWQPSGRVNLILSSHCLHGTSSLGRGYPLWLRPLHEPGPGRRYRVQQGRDPEGENW